MDKTKIIAFAIFYSALLIYSVAGYLGYSAWQESQVGELVSKEPNYLLPAILFIVATIDMVVGFLFFIGIIGKRKKV